MSTLHANVTVLCRDDIDMAAARVTVAHGQLHSVRPGERRLALEIGDARLEPGACATRVSLHLGGSRDFSFFLRDVNAAAPILLPALGVAVVPVGDSRSYEQVEADVRTKGLVSENQRIGAAAEESYEAACRITRNQVCPTWLGLSRDVRIFRVAPQTDGPAGQFGYWGRVEPWNHSLPRDIPENKDAIRYTFVIGRGAMCEVDIKRRLEDGCLPILTSTQRDGDVEYRLTMFATLERGPLSEGAVRGTHPVAALANTLGAMLTKEELSLYDGQLRRTEIRECEQEVICWVHVEAVNTGAVPRYAYFQGAGEPGKSTFDGTTGYSRRDDGNVVALNHLNGAAMPQKEMAILLQPGGSVRLDLLFPHRPVNAQRAAGLAAQSYVAHFEGCRAYWRDKLASAARISVPEQAIDERIRAGLLHLDLNTLGLADEGHLLATVGWYSPIGSESSPMIQFYDSMGWHKLAERSIQFFLDRQRADGFIQTFGGYQLETGPALWTIGEHFRYTRDAAWARRIQGSVLKACEYILRWRARNQREELRGKGYGLLDGKVADPEDFFHSFMLNGLAYLGLKRIAEMYGEIDVAFAGRIAAELAPYLADIRAAYAQNVANSPVVPLGDGTWVPSFGPWAEYPGPVSLFAEGGSWFSHGAFAARDTLIGALYLGIGEVLDPREPLAEWLLLGHQELMTHRNAGFSQPYYCRHDWLHLKRGEVKQFLKTYYNQMTALQDRSSYTFWEHYYGVSQHKTHEEGWFLMQTRWMLWHEDVETGTLNLLSMIPRAWMEDGKEIRLERCVSHFGRFDLHVTSRLATGEIIAEIRFHEPGRLPRSVSLRLPHPKSERPVKSSTGEYDSETESVLLRVSAPSLTLRLTFA